MVVVFVVDREFTNLPATEFPTTPGTNPGEHLEGLVPVALVPVALVPLPAIAPRRAKMISPAFFMFDEVLSDVTSISFQGKGCKFPWAVLWASRLRRRCPSERAIKHYIIGVIFANSGNLTTGPWRIGQGMLPFRVIGYRFFFHRPLRV